MAYVGFPALIATLATFYAYKSLAIVINNQSPISTPPIQALFSITQSVELPVFGAYVPDVPLGLFTFLLPTVVVVWLLLARTTYGRRLYADRHQRRRRPLGRAPGARHPVQGLRRTPGLISGLVAVVTVGAVRLGPARTPASPATAWRCPRSPSPSSAAWRSPAASAGSPVSCSRRC